MKKGDRFIYTVAGDNNKISGFVNDSVYRVSVIQGAYVNLKKQGHH